MKYFDSDAISWVANLSNLTGWQRDQIRTLTDFGELNSENCDFGQRLLHFIKAEKPYFLPKIDLSDLKSVFAVRPKQANRRILPQQGAFFIFGLQQKCATMNSGLKLCAHSSRRSKVQVARRTERNQH